MAGQIKLFLGVARCRPAARGHATPRLDWVNWSKGQLYNINGPSPLAQLIGATWQYELRVELAAVLALACRVRRRGINDAPLRPDPNPLQVHLAHSRTQNASSGAISLRPRSGYIQH